MELKIKIPESINDLTLRQFVNYKQHIGDDEISNDEHLVKLLQHFCDLTEKQVKALRPDDIEQIGIKITECLEEKPEHRLRFKLKGVHYGMIPNLDDMSYGEYKDLTTYVSQMETLPNFMAVLYRPITMKQGKKYEIEKYTGTEHAKDIADMPLGIYRGAMLFFCDLTNELLKLTRDYTAEQIAKAQSSDKSGDSTQTYINYLQEISNESIESLTKMYISACSI